MPNRLMLKTFTRAHMFWYRLSGGLIGGRVGKARFLLLTTTGRKSGRPWTTPLTYTRDGDDLVLIASNGGSDRHPAWYLNLTADPRATVQAGHERRAVRAVTAGPEQRERLWSLMAAIYPGYESYRKATKREIPVVVLHPDSGGA